MIAHLEGVRELVDYRPDTYLRLYDNTDFEEYPMHWHTCMEVIMPVQGTYTLRCGKDTEFFTLQEQDILLILPGVLHNLSACRGERYILQAELSRALPLKSLEAASTMLAPAVRVTPDTDPDIYPRLRELMDTIIREYSESAPMYEAAVYGHFLEMIVLLARSRSRLQTPPGASSTKQKEYLDKFIDICAYINEHCAEDLTLDMVAERAGFSKYHFTRLFRQFTDMSFYKYLNQKRIERAELLLGNPSLSVTEISLASGFTSLSSFIRMFKIIKGCTPSQFRAMRDT